MNNIALERIQAQMAQSVPTAVQVAFDAIKAVTLSPPISPEELRAMLLTELDCPAPSAPQPVCSPEAIHFESIYDFAAWYGANQTGFNERQRVALDTILQTRAAIEVGCACKRHSREAMAHDYFNTFWTHNKKTDLLETIAKIVGASRVSISSICSFPPPSLD